jgi:hypothetical protein
VSLSGAITCGPWLNVPGKGVNRTLGGAGGSVADVGVGRCRWRVLVDGTLGGVAGARVGRVVVAKMSASCWMACIWSSPRGERGDAEAGLRIAQQRSMAALMAASAEDSCGIFP